MRAACRSAVAGARLSIGTATSSMITVVPTGRTAPTAGNSPLRIFQYFSISKGSVLNSIGRDGGVSDSPSDTRCDFGPICTLYFDEQRGRVRPETREKIRHAWLTRNRSEAGPIHQLDG